MNSIVQYYSFCILTIKTSIAFDTKMDVSPSKALDLLASSLTITLLKLTNPEGDYDSDNKKWY